MTRQVILITGVAGGWGQRLAARLTQDPSVHVIGLDDKPPRSAIGELDFIQADVRNPALTELLESEKIQAVCHLKFTPVVRPSQTTSDVNVKGTANVLSACAQAGVSKVVLKSSALVYGAHADNPAFLTESHALRGDRRLGAVRDLLEIESLYQDHRRRSPDTPVTVLRFANIVGPTVNTWMTRFLKNSFAPVPLGFDPLLQVIHADDVIEALVRAALVDAPGVFNIAAEGVLPLLQALALARKKYLPLPHWLVRKAGQPLSPDYLRHTWVADLTQMRASLGFAPHFTAEETLRDFATRGQTSSQALTFDKERLRSLVARRRQVRGEEHG